MLFSKAVLLTAEADFRMIELDDVLLIRQEENHRNGAIQGRARELLIFKLIKYS